MGRYKYTYLNYSLKFLLNISTWFFFFVFTEIKNNSVTTTAFTGSLASFWKVQMQLPSNNSTEATGCPIVQSWCLHTPVIHLGQYITADILIGLGYPVCNVMSYTLYSKILGPRPQVSFKLGIFFLLTIQPFY